MNPDTRMLEYCLPGNKQWNHQQSLIYETASFPNTSRP